MEGPRTLAIDVGGSGLKATVLSPDGEMLTERVRRETPYPCTPDLMLDELTELAKELPEYDRVSVGFPGAIRGPCTWASSREVRGSRRSSMSR